MTNPLLTAIPKIGNSNGANTRLNLSLATVLPLKDAAAIAEFHTWNLANDGTLYPALVYSGAVYEFDAGDNTTAHDPDAGCITDASGRRYKRALADKPDHIVLDKDLSEPPANPLQQARYFVADAATGAWTGHDGEIAIYGRQGWFFKMVNEGHLIYVSDEAVYYHMSDSGELVKGLGSLALANGAIRPTHILRNFGIPVEAIQDDPPENVPGDGVAYVVGDTPTGAWLGQTGKVAIANNNAWDFFAAYEGAEIFNNELGYTIRYENGSWVRSVQKPATIDPMLLEIDQSGVTLTQNVYTVVKTITLKAKTSQTIKFNLREFTATLPGGGANFSIFMRVRRDNETVAVFERNGGIISTLTISELKHIVPADDQEHTYYFEIHQNDPTRQFQIIIKAEITTYDVLLDTDLDQGV